MNVHGNDSNSNVFGNNDSSVWGTAADANGWGDRPADVFGNSSFGEAGGGDEVIDTILDFLGGFLGG